MRWRYSVYNTRYIDASLYQIDILYAIYNIGRGYLCRRMNGFGELDERLSLYEMKVPVHDII